MNLSVIIPNLNGGKLLPSCLQSVTLAIKNCPSSHFEIIIVDNNSSDNSLEILSQFFPNHKIILNSTNLGFAASVNQGIKASGYNHVCILNNDVFLDQNFFKLIFPHIVPNISTYCGTIKNASGSQIESQGITFNFNGSCIQNNHHQIYLPHFPPYPVWGSSAAAVIYQKSSLLEIGLFDETFFAYIEDVDLSFRLSKSHQLTLCIPQAFAYHLGGSTSSKYPHFRQYYTFRNWIKLIVKNYSLSQLISHLPSILIERIRNLSYLLKSFIT